MGLGRHLKQEPSQSPPAKMQSARRWGTESGLQAAASTTALERRRVSFHCPMSSAFGSAFQVYGTLDATLFIPHGESQTDLYNQHRKIPVLEKTP